MNMRYYLRSLLVVFVALSVLFLNTFSAFASSEDLIINHTTREDNYLLFDSEPFGDENSVSTMEQIETGNNEYNVRLVAQYGKYSTVGNFSSSYEYLVNDTGSGQLNKSGVAQTRPQLSSNYNPFTYYMRDQYVVRPTGHTRMASQGQSLSFSLDNVRIVYLGYDSSDNLVRFSHFNPEGIKWIELWVYDENFEGTRLDTITENFNVSVNGELVTIGADFDNVPFDVYGVNIGIVFDADVAFNNNNGDSSLTSNTTSVPVQYRGYGYADSHLSLNINDNTAGLLSSIIGFIQSILQGVINIFEKLGEILESIGGWFSELFTKLGTWFTNLLGKIGEFMSAVTSSFSTLFQHIINLPGIMWGWIEDGLKALFVPSEDYISEYKNKWQLLLEDRFGAIYQSVDILITYVNMLENNANQSTITLPSTTIDLPDEETFTFGGYDVKVVPDGFTFLANAVKLAIDIIVSFAVINALKRRFEGLLGDRL